MIPGRFWAPLAVALWVAFLPPRPAAAGPRERADRVFVRGVVHTGDPARPRAEALAIRGERILAVGSTAEILRLAERRTDVLDLKGRVVVPGFDDAHVHLMGGGLSLSSLSLEGAWELKEIQRRIATYARSHPDPAWVTGRGWPYAAFPGGSPEKSLLDAAVPDRPAWMEASDGHTGWCNSLALKAAGITRYTPSPPNGTIVKDASGEPTGMFQEAAQAYVTRLLPRPSPGERERALRAALDHAASLGLTSVQDAPADLDDIEAYEHALERGLLNVRIRAALPLEREPSKETLSRYKDLRDRHRGGRLKLGAVQGVLDGGVRSKAAAMLEPYAGGGLGQVNLSPEVLDAAVALYDREGFQVLLQAVGDRAVRIALDAYERAARANGTSGRRHRVEQVEVPHPADLGRFRALGVVASTQAISANPDKDALEVYAAHLGPERAARALPWKLLDEAGAVQAFGSGWPAFPCDPLRGIYSAITRTTPEGSPAGGWQPHLRISPEAALRHFTRDAAYASFDETDQGTLAPGMLADLVVLSDDILAPPPERILKTRVLLTVVGGEDTYRSKEF